MDWIKGRNVSAGYQKHNKRLQNPGSFISSFGSLFISSFNSSFISSFVSSFGRLCRSVKDAASAELPDRPKVCSLQIRKECHCDSDQKKTQRREKNRTRRWRKNRNHTPLEATECIYIACEVALLSIFLPRFLHLLPDSRINVVMQLKWRLICYITDNENNDSGWSGLFHSVNCIQITLKGSNPYTRSWLI